MKIMTKVHTVAISTVLVQILCIEFFPNWIGTPVVWLIGVPLFWYIWLAIVFHVGSLGKKIQKEIVDEDEAYRASLKSLPPWKRPPPDS